MPSRGTIIRTVPALDGSRRPFGCRGFESHQPPHFPLMETPQTDARELAELVAELERAEAFEQRLRQLISDARDQLAAGNASVALSMLNAALSDIDAATDVVTPS